MSSFPILRLPLVALRNVADCWDPVELYKFSQISRKTKKIGKSVSKSPNKIDFYIRYDHLVELYYLYIMYDFDIMEIMKENALHEGPLSAEMFNVVSEIMDIFKTLNKISFHTHEMSEYQLYSLILWISSLPQPSITFVSFYTPFGKSLAIFWKYYMKPTETLHIQGGIRYSFNEPLEFSEVEFGNLVATKADWLRLRSLMALNFVDATFLNTDFTGDELGSFLKSWKENGTNSRMKKCKLTLRGPIILRTILDGLSPIFEDSNSIDSKHKKCHIQREDGKIATIR